MNLRGLDLNLLVILDALLTEQNVTRAAEQINLSQSATSGALARLRNFFDDELLVQVGRKMVLTPLGQSLVVPVRDVLLQIQGTIASKAQFDPAHSDRTFKIMGPDYILTILIPEVLRFFEQNAPHIKIDLRETSNTVLEELERGEFDLIIIPYYFSSSAHPREIFYEEGFVCAVWEENSLVGEQITLEQFLEMGHIVVQLGKDRVPSFEEWFLKQYGLERRVEAVAPLYTMLPGFIIGTNKIVTMQATLAKYYEQFLPIRLITFPGEISNYAEVLQWNKFKDQDPGLVWLRQILKDTIKKLIDSNSKIAE